MKKQYLETGKIVGTHGIKGMTRVQVWADDNEFLGQFLPILTKAIQKTIELNYNLETIAEEAYEDHIMIMKFLKNRDSIGMKSALTIHLHHAVINEQISFD